MSYAENSLGGAAVVGTFVARDGRTTFGNSGNPAASLEARQMTLITGRKKLGQILNRLAAVTGYRAQSTLQDQANVLYEQALHQGLARGRRTLHILSGAIYISSVRAREPYLLIDIAEATETNVFELGTSAMTLARSLGLSLSPNDPSVFMRRYADQLNMGPVTYQVTQDALRILQLMQRDWISTGRRPNGLCAACLLLASRAHGFKFSLHQLAQVVNLSENTIKLRLNELSKTTESSLSLEQLDQTTTTSSSSPTQSLPAISTQSTALIAIGDTSPSSSTALSDPTLALTTTSPAASLINTPLSANPPSFRRSLMNRAQSRKWRGLLQSHPALAEILLQGDMTNFDTEDIMNLSELAMSKIVSRLSRNLRSGRRHARALGKEKGPVIDNDAATAAATAIAAPVTATTTTTTAMTNNKEKKTTKQEAENDSDNDDESDSDDQDELDTVAKQAMVEYKTQQASQSTALQELSSIMVQYQQQPTGSLLNISSKQRMHIRNALGYLLESNPVLNPFFNSSISLKDDDNMTSNDTQSIHMTDTSSNTAAREATAQFHKQQSGLVDDIIQQPEVLQAIADILFPQQLQKRVRIDQDGDENEDDEMLFSPSTQQQGNNNPAAQPPNHDEEEDDDELDMMMKSKSSSSTVTTVSTHVKRLKTNDTETQQQQQQQQLVLASPPPPSTALINANHALINTIQHDATMMMIEAPQTEVSTLLHEFNCLARQAVLDVSLFRRECELTLDDLDEEELDGLILLPEHQEQRKRLWETVLERTPGITHQPRDLNTESGEGRKRARQQKTEEEAVMKAVNLESLGMVASPSHNPYNSSMFTSPSHIFNTSIVSNNRSATTNAGGLNDIDAGLFDEDELEPFDSIFSPIVSRQRSMIGTPGSGFHSDLASASASDEPSLFRSHFSGFSPFAATPNFSLGSGGEDSQG